MQKIMIKLTVATNTHEPQVQVLPYIGKVIC